MSPPDRLVRRLASRRGAWLVLIVSLVAAGAVLGVLRDVDGPGRGGTAPATAESTRVTQELSTMPDHDVDRLLLVADRDGAEVTQGDLETLNGLADALEQATGKAAAAAEPAPDGRAAVLTVPLGTQPGSPVPVVEQVRQLVQQHEADLDGMRVQVTGDPALAADLASSFDGADLRLLLVTVGIVAILLLLTYRSPVLWLVPLAVVGLADGVAGAVATALGGALDLPFDSGIVSVLVFGAGTNYALLLISRYREELRRTEQHRIALARAWRGSAPAILASNLTVVLALSTLLLATLPSTRGLSLTAASGLLVALVMVLVLLPAALAVTGRGIFWPFVPRPADQPRHARGASTTRDAAPTGFWAGLARRTVAHPVRVLVGAAVLLGVLASGLIGTSVGLGPVDRFRVPAESTQGLQMLAEHGPSGVAEPMVVVTDAGSADQVASAVSRVPGVGSVEPSGGDAQRSVLTVAGSHDPGSPEALDLVGDVRAAANGVDHAHALVGGAGATDLDARAGERQDLLVVAPSVLAVVGLVLLVLLRSLVAPVLLLLVNVASAAAAIGAGAWLSRRVFDVPALDLPVPLLAFLFLVALGIDYTIFLVHRAREEARTHETTDAMVRAVAHTGAVITSAGVVLAAVFAALGVLPLITLGQLGLIVGVGVLLDTLLVRTLVVPAVGALLGDRWWWPGDPRRSAVPKRSTMAG